MKGIQFKAYQYQKFSSIKETRQNSYHQPQKSHKEITEFIYGPKTKNNHNPNHFGIPNRLLILFNSRSLIQLF